jgi:predicted nuclease of restriction endonuclease-like (RecB) superfamily
MKGFSRTNLMNMRRFAFEYPSEEFVQQAVGQITRSHNILLLEKISDPVQRVRYAQKAVQNGRSRNTMTHRIETDLYKRD